MFSDNVRKVLKERRISQKQMLADLHMGRNNFTLWDSGRVPRQTTVDLIANYLGVSSEILLEGVDLDKQDAPWVVSTDDNDMLPLSGQEKALIEMFREVSPRAQMEMIHAILNVYDRETLA